MQGPGVCNKWQCLCTEFCGIAGIAAPVRLPEHTKHLPLTQGTLNEMEYDDMRTIILDNLDAEVHYSKESVNVVSRPNNQSAICNYNNQGKGHSYGYSGVSQSWLYWKTQGFLYDGAF